MTQQPVGEEELIALAGVGIGQFPLGDREDVNLVELDAGLFGHRKGLIAQGSDGKRMRCESDGDTLAEPEELNNHETERTQ